MVKVTLNENLVPSRHPWVKGAPYSDLTLNVLLARKLIRTAQFVFQLRKGSAIFSGYINEHPKGLFTFRLLERGTVVRTLVLSGLSHAGELDIEVRDLFHAVHQDVFAGLAKGQALHLAVY